MLIAKLSNRFIWTLDYFQTWILDSYLFQILYLSYLPPPIFEHTFFLTYPMLSQDIPCRGAYSEVVVLELLDDRSETGCFCTEEEGSSYLWWEHGKNHVAPRCLKENGHL